MKEGKSYSLRRFSTVNGKAWRLYHEDANGSLFLGIIARRRGQCTSLPSLCLQIHDTIERHSTLDQAMLRLINAYREHGWSFGISGVTEDMARCL